MISKQDHVSILWKCSTTKPKLKSLSELFDAKSCNPIDNVVLFMLAGQKVPSFFMAGIQINV